ncbi:MAG: hypothetical protein L6R42_006718 [Xanthoria sp. 1 TBL-2021]|nr:MAG: hypothetical protein L6R42_006718 [Xanthoria sp. 1 TBL-2021]
MAPQYAEKRRSASWRHFPVHRVAWLGGTVSSRPVTRVATIALSRKEKRAETGQETVRDLLHERRFKIRRELGFLEDATQAAAPKTFGTHRVESLDALMPEDHRLFLPNDEMLDKFHNETVFKISAVVNKIMGATQNRAAVFEWVFQASQSSSPVVPASAQDAALNGIEHTSVVAPLYFQKREYSSTLEKLLSDACPRLYKQLVLKSKYLSVEHGFDYETSATTLASHSCEVLKGFLKENLWSLDPMAYVQFHDGMADVFLSALRLKA